MSSASTSWSAAGWDCTAPTSASGARAWSGSTTTIARPTRAMVPSVPVNTKCRTSVRRPVRSVLCARRTGRSFSIGTKRMPRSTSAIAARITSRGYRRSVRKRSGGDQEPMVSARATEPGPANAPYRAAMERARPRVVVVGAGFGGLSVVKGLAGAPVDVTLVDRHNFHTFSPLLYQVATAGLAAEDIAPNVRGIVQRAPNVEARLATVVGIDLDRREVVCADGRSIAYDVLVLAAGTVSS